LMTLPPQSSTSDVADSNEALEQVLA
jgi:hypothetical protein